MEFSVNPTDVDEKEILASPAFRHSKAPGHNIKRHTSIRKRKERDYTLHYM